MPGQEVTPLVSEAGIEVLVDLELPLAALTATINNACDTVVTSTEGLPVVLRLIPTELETRAWPPSDVSVQQVNRWERAVRRLERLPAMSISVASGICRGPALDLMLSTDFRMATPDLMLLLPVNDRHVWPGMAAFRLVQQLGLAKARQLLLWGDGISATRALEACLVDQVVEDLSSALNAAVVMMGRISDKELAIRRQLMFDAVSISFDEALGGHLAACDRELRRLRSLDSAATDQN